MPDIFDEVEEDLRAERARKFWERYGRLLSGVVLLVLGGVAGWQGWEWWQNRQTQQAAAAYIQAQRDTEAEGADFAAMATRFEAIARDAPAGYRTLAQLRAAALRAEAGQREQARVIWDSVARDGEAETLYRDLATVLWALHGVDSADPAAVAARVTPLAQPGQPWSASAREVLALLQLRRGETAAAREAFRALAADTGAPPGVRERAQRIASGIGG